MSRPHPESSFGHHIELEDSFSYSSSSSGGFSSSISSSYAPVTPNSTPSSFGCQTPPPQRDSPIGFDHRLAPVMVMTPPPTMPDYMNSITLQHSTQGYYREDYREEYPPMTPPRTGNPMEMGIPAPLSFMDHHMPPLPGTPAAYTYTADGLPPSPPFMAHTLGYPTHGTSSPGASAAPMWVHGNSSMPMFEHLPPSRSPSMSLDMRFDGRVRQEPAGDQHLSLRGSGGRARPTANMRRTARQQSNRNTSKKSIRRAGEDMIGFYPKNYWKCSFEGCIKRYARHEHKVRHEKSHSEGQYFSCHPSCPRKHQTRDRFDNFHSHFKKHMDEKNPNYIPGAEQWWEEHYRDMDKRRKPRQQRIKREA